MGRPRSWRGDLLTRRPLPGPAQQERRQRPRQPEAITASTRPPSPWERTLLRRHRPRGHVPARRHACFDPRVEGEQIGLGSDRGDRLEDAPDVLGVAPEATDRGGGGRGRGRRHAFMDRRISLSERQRPVLSGTARPLGNLGGPGCRGRGLVAHLRSLVDAHDRPGGGLFDATVTRPGGVGHHGDDLPNRVRRRPGELVRGGVHTTGRLSKLPAQPVERGPNRLIGGRRRGEKGGEHLR